MADDTDFVALYEELGLDAECSVADFKHAYRRRVAQLHPDHPSNSSDISRLQRLNRLYAAAMEFQRAYGRLPGASRITGSEPEAGPPAAAGGMSGDESQSLSGSRSHWRYVLLMVLFGLALYGLAEQEPAIAPDAAESVGTPGQVRPPAADKFLTIGMDREQVRRIQGEPFNFHEQRWEYGPSWIMFDCGKVVDWYSSPLHPLHVQRASPASDAQPLSGARRGC